jgi:hypothetical protein
MIGMMVNRAGSARRMRAYFGVAAGALALVLAAGSACAGDDEPQKGVFDGVLNSIGIKSGPPIDYRERSPLVVPPKLDLPPPEDGSVEKKSGAWPVDSTVKPRQLQEAAKRKKSVPVDQISSTPVDENGKPIGQNGWSELGKMFGLNKQETATFKAEPPRATLVEPPPGYRTPSPDQPYGIGTKAPGQTAEQKTEDKPRSLEDRTRVPH